MRVREGRGHALQQAIRKYGADAFVVKTLAIADDWDYLCDLERTAIAVFGTISPNGYNLTAGGEGVVGRTLTDENRVRMSHAQKSRFQRPEQREAARDAFARGREVSRAKHEARRIEGKPPWLYKLRAGKLKAVLSPEEFKAEHSKRTREAMAKPEVAAKVRQSAADRAANPEWRAKIGDLKRGVSWGKMSDEAKAKITAARKAEWRDPVKREVRLKALEKARAAKAAKKGDK